MNLDRMNEIIIKFKNEKEITFEIEGECDNLEEGCRSVIYYLISRNIKYIDNVIEAINGISCGSIIDIVKFIQERNHRFIEQIWESTHPEIDVFVCKLIRNGLVEKNDVYEWVKTKSIYEVFNFVGELGDFSCKISYMYRNGKKLFESIKSIELTDDLKLIPELIGAIMKKYTDNMESGFVETELYQNVILKAKKMVAIEVNLEFVIKKGDEFIYNVISVEPKTIKEHDIESNKISLEYRNKLIFDIKEQVALIRNDDLNIVNFLNNIYKLMETFYDKDDSFNSYMFRDNFGMSIRLIRNIVSHYSLSKKEPIDLIKNILNGQSSLKKEITNAIEDINFILERYQINPIDPNSIIDKIYKSLEGGFIQVRNYKYLIEIHDLLLNNFSIELLSDYDRNFEKNKTDYIKKFNKLRKNCVNQKHTKLKGTEFEEEADQVIDGINEDIRKLEETESSSILVCFSFESFEDKTVLVISKNVASPVKIPMDR